MPRDARREWSTVLLLVGLAGVVASFLAATFVTHRAARLIDVASDAIAYNSVPSIQHLAAVRNEARQVEQLVDGRLRAQGDARASSDRARVEESLANLDGEVSSYLALRGSEEGMPFVASVRRSALQFHTAVRQVLALADAGALDAARAGFASELRPSRVRLLDATTHAIDQSADHGRQLAVLIREERRRALAFGLALDALCGLLAVLGAALVWREVSRRSAFLRAQAQIQEERAGELELFAGRVAHDISNPLGVARMAVDLALKREPSDPDRHEVLGRARRSLARTQSIVEGLLRFARAGAKPHPGETVEVAPVVQGVVSDLVAEAEGAGAEIRLDITPCRAACDRGVLSSIVANLVHNAVKYLGDGPVRCIDVRVREHGAIVRVEVQDTGPGLPPDLADRAFELYVRGAHQDRAGLGLGLATVRRLVEGHGGQVGVESQPGRGCRFWFELPAASARPADLRAGP